ncbi:unknown [Akkermansia muciniphila CAG:154]|nr:unknown [Akkermansia muciniphila CAG:154]
MNLSIDILFPLMVDKLMDKSDKSLVRLELIRKHIGIPLNMFSDESL